MRLDGEVSWSFDSDKSPSNPLQIFSPHDHRNYSGFVNSVELFYYNSSIYFSSCGPHNNSSDYTLPGERYQERENGRWANEGSLKTSSRNLQHEMAASAMATPSIALSSGGSKATFYFAIS